MPNASTEQVETTLMLKPSVEISQYFLRKLTNFTRLSSEDQRAMKSVVSNTKIYGPHTDIIRVDDDPSHINLILDGWACRYKQLPDGRRQIIAFLLPGDFCDSHVYILRRMDHSIGILTSASICRLSRTQIEGVANENHRLHSAFWWDTLVAAAVQREWTVNLGQRTAFERTGHLFCELFTRLNAVGLVENDSFNMPLTQTELADALGLSLVHINRTLQDLRQSSLIKFKSKSLTILDFDALKLASLFNADYLHLDRIGRHLDADD